MTKSQSVSPGRKFDQVVRGAAAIFLRDGFAGASVDDIARAARVSKATLYSYFPDKSHMFQEAMRSETMRLDGSFALDIPADLDPGQAIPVIMARIAEWLADPAHAGLCRVHLAEAPRFAGLSARFHAKVARILQDAVRPHLDRWVAAGQLCLDDTGIAARQVIALSGAGLMDRLLLGRGNIPADAGIQAAADLFLRAALPPATARPAPRHGRPLMQS